MKSRTAQSRLDTLRQSRSLPRDATTMSPLVQSMLREFRAAHRESVAADDAWKKIAPAAIASLVSKAESGGGVLKLTPKASTARFVIDRWLRTGGLAALRAADPKIKSVKILSSGRGKP